MDIFCTNQFSMIFLLTKDINYNNDKKRRYSDPGSILMKGFLTSAIKSERSKQAEQFFFMKNSFSGISCIMS